MRSARHLAAPLSAALVVFAGSGVLLGWLVGSTELAGLGSDLVAIQPLGAVAFILAGAALGILYRPQVGAASKSKLWARLLAAMLIILAVTAFAERALKWTPAIEERLFANAAGSGQVLRPAPMSYVAALNFALLGASLFLLDSRRRPRLAEIPTLIVLSISILAVVAHAYGVRALSVIPVFSTFSLQAAVLFVLLCLGLLYARSDRGTMQVLTSEGFAANVARRLFPVAFLLPLFAGWLTQQGELAGLYDPRSGVAIFASVNAVAIGALVWLTAESLNRTERDRSRAQKALDQSLERHRYTLDHLLEGCQIIDFDWRYLYLNDSALKHGRQTRQALIGHTMMEIYPGIEHTPMFEALQDSMADRSPRQVENKFQYPDGASAWFELSIQPVPEGVFILSIDITERKWAEAEIARVNAELEERIRRRTTQLEAANQELEAFSYSVSHDLRAPLRAIDGFSRIILEDHADKLDAEALRLLGVVRANTQQMGNLIEDLLNFSKISRRPLAMQEVLTAEVAAAALTELHTEHKGRQIEITLGDLPDCRGDPILLKQVWFNLLSNAFKFTRRREQARIELGTTPTGSPSAVTYFVRDNGAGFAMQYADKLFGVFQRLHRAEDYEGTGVGLAMVQRIIHRHGGRVWAEAEPEHGATFYFTLPAIEGPGRQATPIQEQGALSSPAMQGKDRVAPPAARR